MLYDGPKRRASDNETIRWDKRWILEAIAVPLFAVLFGGLITASITWGHFQSVTEQHDIILKKLMEQREIASQLYAERGMKIAVLEQRMNDTCQNISDIKKDLAELLKMQKRNAWK